MSSALFSILAVSSCSASFRFCHFSTAVPLFMRSMSSASSSASLFRPLGDCGDVVAADADPRVALSTSSPESSLARLRLALIPSTTAFAFWAFTSALLCSALDPDPLAPAAFELAAAASGSMAMASVVIPSNLLSAARSNRSLDFASCRSSSSKRRRHANECWFRPFPMMMALQPRHPGVPPCALTSFCLICAARISGSSVSGARAYAAVFGASSVACFAYAWFRRVPDPGVGSCSDSLMFWSSSRLHR